MRLDIHVYFHEDTETAAALRALKKEVHTMSERLSREIAETRQAVTDLTGRYQTKLDALQVEIDRLKEALATGDTETANAAADALDALQTEMSALGVTPPTGEETTAG